MIGRAVEVEVAECFGVSLARCVGDSFGSNEVGVSNKIRGVVLTTVGVSVSFSASVVAVTTGSGVREFAALQAVRTMREIEKARFEIDARIT